MTIISPSSPRRRLTSLSQAVVLALGVLSPGVHAVIGTEAGSGEDKTITGDTVATGFLEDALYAYDGGRISGVGVSLSSQTGSLIRAEKGGSVVLDGVTMEHSFGPQAVIENGGRVALSDVTFTSDEVLSVSGSGSALTVRDSAPPVTGTAFDVSQGGGLTLDHVSMASPYSRSGAAMIRAKDTASQVAIKNADLSTQDSAVLKLTDGSAAVVKDSRLTTSPTRPEETGYYSVIQLDRGSHLSAENVIVNFDAEGAGLFLGEASTAIMQGGRIEGQHITGDGAGVELLGTGSRAELSGTTIRVAGDRLLSSTIFSGVYAGDGGDLSITGGSTETDGTGMAGVRADFSRVHLADTTVRTLQDDASGVMLYGASGEITGSQVETLGQRSPHVRVVVVSN